MLVNLTSSVGTNIESRVLSEIWPKAAQKFGDVKFCAIRADMCIDGYPDRNTPTVLIYKDGDIKRQIVTLALLKGVRTTLRDLGKLLVEVGAIQENDVRLKQKDDDEREKDDAANEDDDEWD